MPFTMLLANPIVFLLYLGILIICITVHEFAHALVADRLGDPTPRLDGRVTLNPLAHLDLLGTIMLVLFRFGWGKPVVFDPYNLRNPRRDSALIALAGPAGNLLLATVLSVILRVTNLAEPISAFVVALVTINVILAIFNLIPIHPLDGGKILIGFAPKQVAREWDQVLQQYGIFILLLLILPLYNGSSPLFSLLNPVFSFVLKLLLG